MRACVRVCEGVYVMITCVNNILPVSILVTENVDNTVENTHNKSLFCCFALPALVIH